MDKAQTGGIFGSHAFERRNASKEIKISQENRDPNIYAAGNGNPKIEGPFHMNRSARGDTRHLEFQAKMQTLPVHSNDLMSNILAPPLKNANLTLEGYLFEAPWNSKCHSLFEKEEEERNRQPIRTGSWKITKKDITYCLDKGFVGFPNPANSQAANLEEKSENFPLNLATSNEPYFDAFSFSFSKKYTKTGEKYDVNSANDFAKIRASKQDHSS